MQAKGARTRTVIDFETIFGANPGAKAGKILPVNTNEVAAKQSLTNPATLRGIRMDDIPVLGRVSIDGSLQVPLDLTAIGYWLKGLLGQDTVTGTGPYVHTFKVPTAALPSMVISKEFLDIAQTFIYNGIKISELKLPFGQDGEVVATMTVMGATRTIQTTAYDAACTAVVMNRLNTFQAALKEGGATIATVLSGDLAINNGLDGNSYCVGAGTARGDIPEGIAACTGTLKALFADVSLINKGINQTETSLTLTYTSGANSLVFSFPEVMYDVVDVPVTGAVGLAATLNWRAYWNNDAGNSPVIITLTNGQATY